MEKLFSFEKIENYLKALTREALHPIQNLDPKLLEGIGQERYIDYLYEKSVLYLPDLHFNKLERSDKQVRNKDKSLMINEKLQRLEFIWELTLHIPVSGEISRVKNVNILQFKPVYQFQEIDFAYFSKDEVQIKIYVSNEEEEEGTLIKEKNEKINLLIQTYGMLKQEVDNYNYHLKKLLKEKIHQVRMKHEKARKKINTLSIPIKRNLDSTIKISPKFRKKIKIEDFVKKTKISKIEPYISNEVYRDILKITNDCLKNIERMPSLYKNREESDLRDFILFVLDPNFDLGSATGETFNKKGKTDVLLQYDKTNVFIAECKYWKGIKVLHETIDQLLRYLTWRDSKAAIIFFVRQKDITGVINKVRKETRNHKNHIEFCEEITESVLLYRFHLDENLSKDIWITIMFSHTYDEEYTAANKQ